MVLMGLPVEVWLITIFWPTFPLTFLHPSFVQYILIVKEHTGYNKFD